MTTRHQKYSTGIPPKHPIYLLYFPPPTFLALPTYTRSEPSNHHGPRSIPPPYRAPIPNHMNAQMNRPRQPLQTPPHPPTTEPKLKIHRNRKRNNTTHSAMPPTNTQSTENRSVTSTAPCWLRSTSSTIDLPPITMQANPHNPNTTNPSSTPEPSFLVKTPQPAQKRKLEDAADEGVEEDTKRKGKLAKR